MIESDEFYLSPINFFAISADCHQLGLNEKLGKKHLLPSTSEICQEYSFAKVYLGWNLEGIFALVEVAQSPTRSSFPNITNGDSIELFFDTRDVKTSGYNTRFCHHFYFLPQPVDDYFKGEITHFRTEDRHELCDSQELQSKIQLKSSSYTMEIFIPKSCLHGYDPEQFQRLGFTYRINRAGGKPQHFSVMSSEYKLEEQPSLWSSLQLV